MDTPKTESDKPQEPVVQKLPYMGMREKDYIPPLPPLLVGLGLGGGVVPSFIPGNPDFEDD